MQFLPIGNEISHEGHTRLSAEQSHRCEETRQRSKLRCGASRAPEIAACKMRDETKPSMAKDWPTAMSNSDRK